VKTVSVESIFILELIFNIKITLTCSKHHKDSHHWWTFSSHSARNEKSLHL